MTAPSIVVAYHTAEGQTANLAERIGATLCDAGATVDIRRVTELGSLAGYAGAVIGGSIHMSHYSDELIAFLNDHVHALEAIPTAHFQVSMTAATGDKDQAQQMVRQLCDQTGFDPDVVGIFAGALAYTRYGWIKRRMVRAIAKERGLDTDTRRDHEYTDWAAVEHFAQDVYQLVAEPTAVQP